MVTEIIEPMTCGIKDEAYFWQNMSFLVSRLADSEKPFLSQNHAAQVENRVFRVPTHQFIHGSRQFAERLEKSLRPVETEGVIRLENVTAKNFKTFLKLLYPMYVASSTDKHI